MPSRRHYYKDSKSDRFESTVYIDFNLPIIQLLHQLLKNLSINSFDSCQIRVYRNPVEDLLHLELSAALNEKSMRIFNLNGKLIKTFENQKTLDLSQIGSGIYILNVETGIVNFHEKVIKR